MNKLDFGFGNPFAVNTVLKQYYSPSVFLLNNLLTQPYETDNGNEELVQITRNLIYFLTGQKYEYVAISHGATGGINSILRIIANEGEKDIETLDFGYPFYSQMIQKSGLNRKKIKYTTLDLDAVRSSKYMLLDSPHNPSGVPHSPIRDGIVWDATYHNGIYLNPFQHSIKPSSPLINVGSFGKLLGMAGIRLGWVATNDKELFDKITHDMLYETATVNNYGQKLVVDFINNVNLDNYFKTCRSYLDSNRQILYNAFYKITSQTIQENGMFYFFQSDDKLNKMLDDCNIIYSVFKEYDNIYTRLNAAQILGNMVDLSNRIKAKDGLK